MDEVLVRAPTQLTAQFRGPFRDEALAALAQLQAAPRGARLVIDLAETVRVDSAGLGTLVMLQLRASEHRHAIALRGASEEVRFLLLMTKLEDRFEIEPRP
jgi:ABC-type transporter Mla MlaB component